MAVVDGGYFENIVAREPYSGGFSKGYSTNL